LGDKALTDVHWRDYKPLKTSLNLNLVQRAALHPQRVSLFHHKSNTGRVAVRGGSGVYEVTSSNPKVVGARLNSLKNAVELTPVGDGTAELKLVDLCLPAQSVAMVSVSGVGHVELRCVSKVQFGDTIEATVSVFDK
jgi:hypothetical protein